MPISKIIDSRLHMDEHDDDVEPEVEEGEFEVEEFPILDDEDEDTGGVEDDEELEIDPDESEL